MQLTLMRVAMLLAAVFTVTAGCAGLTDNDGPESGTTEVAAIAADITPGITLGEGAARQFAAQELTIGDQFPAIDVVDSEGTPFNTGDLKGQYTVLVGGCLT